MNHAHHVYRDRRTALIKSMRDHASGGLALVPTAPEVARNRDSHFPYRHDSYFYYLTGFPEPEAVVALVAGPDGDKHVLFCRDKNEEREIWDGFRYGPDAAREIFGFDEAHPISQLDSVMADLAADRPALYTPLGMTEAWDRKVAQTLNEVRDRVRSGVTAPETVVDVRGTLDHMRLTKDAHEIALMKKAASISSGAHARAMAEVRPGWYEYQAEAVLAHEFLFHGALALAYSSIVASGPNACVLHYRDNNRRMDAGELLLIDAGCEYQGYASDITRTFPVGGRFSGPQRDIYELVLASQMACLDVVKPGVDFHDYHKVAERVLAQGYIDLGLCKGTLDEVLETGTYKQFYMHRAGHWLGMDVHDAGQYTLNGASQKLAPGMVLTVEPGTYIRPADNVPEAFWNIGVRIEDDVLVTASGNDNLTAATPKTVAEVEAACKTLTHDVAVVGAGPVGATLALGLADSGRDVVVLDARAAHTAARGERSLALSHGGRLILERIDVWRAIAGTPGAITPIVAIDISQARGFGSATLSAADVGLPALGYVVSSTALQAALDAAMVRAGIAVQFDAKVTTITPGDAHASIAVHDGSDVHARLAVVADGRGASVAGIERVEHDYGQLALIASVTPAAPHRGIAYERFTPAGPVALLPRGDHYGLVWTQTPAQAAATLALSDSAFLAALARHAGRRIGTLTNVGERRTFPLTLEYARPATVNRVVLLGNAAQTLHPVAGQGFNIGLRDAHELAQRIAATRGDDCGAPTLVAAFARGRRPDRAAGIAFTHGLTRLFANDATLLRWPRGIALSLLDALPPARRAFTRAMLFGVR